MSEDELRRLFPKASDDFVARNADRIVSSERAPIMRDAQKNAHNRIRQNSAGLNKTEQAFLDTYLKPRCGETEFILAQAMTLRLGNGVRYTVDFVLGSTIPATNDYEDGVHLQAYEVKGFMRDDAAVKVKVAAFMFPWIKFHLATKIKGGGWSIQDVIA
jgi:hypothetical protein